MVGLSGLAVAKITASFMVLGHDGHKNNLGLGLKFEAKGLKVIDYSQKNTHFWEFSEKAVELLREYKQRFPEVIAAASRRGDGQYRHLCHFVVYVLTLVVAMPSAAEVFPGDPDAKLKEAKDWLQSKGVKNFEPVSLFCDQLRKVSLVGD